MAKHRLHLSIETNLYNEIHKRIPKRQISSLVEDLLERELAGDFKQLKIDKLKKELASVEAENTHIQTQKQKQEERAEESYRKAEEDALARRTENMPRRRKGA